MNRQNGAVRIFLYNWPVYVGAWMLALVMVLLFSLAPPPVSTMAALAAGVAVVWSFASLFVSHYIYDRSALVSGRWVLRLVRATTDAWATIHAGLDAEVELDAVMPGRCIARLDIFDPAIMTSPSIARARARTRLAARASPCSPTALPLESEACDAIVVAFTAHEIRDPVARRAFFEELRRALRPGGRVLIVEHLRDLANFLSFGPGFLHFESRREWHRLASDAQLAIASETRITPWVMALALERPR